MNVRVGEERTLEFTDLVTKNRLGRLFTALYADVNRATSLCVLSAATNAVMTLHRPESDATLFKICNSTT